MEQRQFDPPAAPVPAAQQPAPALLTALIGELLVGFDLRRVDSIAAATEEAGTPASVDLAQLLGVTGTAGGRTILARTEGGPACQVLLGDTIRVLAEDTALLQPLPRFLEGLTTQAAIRGLFLLRGRVGFMIDPDRLNELTRATP